LVATLRNRRAGARARARPDAVWPLELPRRNEDRSATRQPAIFLPHGGGPCFRIDAPPPFGRQSWEKLRLALAGVVASLRDFTDVIGGETIFGCRFG
jgi:hypothetical protein